MKRFIITLAAVMTLGSITPAMAQQRRVVRKPTTAVKKKAPARNVAPPVKMPDINDDEFLVNEHAAFLGVLVKQSEDKVKAALQQKGFVYTTEPGYEAWEGTAYEEPGYVYIMDNGISFKEKRRYTKSGAITRLANFWKGISAVTGAMADTSGFNNTESGEVEGGTILLTLGDITYTLQYNNEDEVNFDSKYYYVTIMVSEP